MKARLSALALLASILIPVPAVSQQTGPAAAIHPQLIRLQSLAQEKPGWTSATTLSGKILALREEINRLDIVSEPVSDRYLITKLGGPIDLVHFLYLCAQTCSGSMTTEEALLRQWKSEGGGDFQKGLSRTYFTDATPDDFPSNALGALLGTELKGHEKSPDFDLVRRLDAFLRPLQPVPDEVAKKYSHRTVVMGLAEHATREKETSRREWFTAEPLFLLSLLDPGLKAKIPNAAAALRAAGFEVYAIDGKPIGIRRTR